MSKILLLIGLWWQVTPQNVYANSANKVWFEFRDNGAYRVFVNYTIPDLKESREAYVDFLSKKEAETFYWHIVRGGDFHGGKPIGNHFHIPSAKPDPW